MSCNSSSFFLKEEIEEPFIAVALEIVNLGPVIDSFQLYNIAEHVPLI